jgi:hypothetical protein
MKTRTLLLSLTAAAALVVTPAALAHGKPDGERGKPANTGTACKPRVGVNLKGTLSKLNTDSTFEMLVSSANRHGARFVGTTPVLIKVTPDTKIRKHGKVAFDKLVLGDKLKVMFRACKADLKSTTATFDLVARHIKAKTPEPAPVPPAPAPPAPAA